MSKVRLAAQDAIRAADRADASANGELQTDMAANRRRAKAYRDRGKARDDARRAAYVAARHRPVSEGALMEDRATLDAWLALDGARQRKLRPLVETVMAGRRALLQARIDFVREPSVPEFRRLLAGFGEAVTDDAARNRLRRVKSLEGEGMPWPEAPASTDRLDAFLEEFLAGSDPQPESV